MPAKKVATFFNQNILLSYKRGVVVLRSDEEKIQYIYYLQKGYIKQSIISEKGDELILNIFKPGSYFPIMMAINKISNHYNFETISNVLLRRARTEQVIEFLKVNKDVLYDLTKRLGKGIIALLTNMEYLSTSDAHSRVLAGVLLYAKRFGVRTDNAVKIDLSFTHRDLANFLGLARETVTRELNELIRVHVIAKHDTKFVIEDLSVFEEYIRENGRKSHTKFWELEVS